MKMKRPTGIVTYRVYRHGVLLRAERVPNLFVNAGLPALAALLGGDYAGEFCSVIGVGSGTAAPTVADTGLTAPAYYKPLDGHSEDGLGSVTFNWSLTTGDTGADGINIGELGLFANHTGIGVPGSTAPTPFIAHRAIAVIAFTTGMSISGTWTLTF